MKRDISRARKLRRDLTDAEELLWFHLRDRRLSGLKFRRQHPIGMYVTDFCCTERKLVVELDGGQHAETDQLRSDDARTSELARRGYRVIRFWNDEVLKRTETVLEAIWQELSKTPPSP